MSRFFSSSRHFLIAILGVALAGLVCANAQQQKNPDKPGATTKAAAATEASAEPDKILYDRAMVDMKHARYTESRLTLQTLINTYPDSEYLAKAKLAVADSYYKEGGTGNNTQAIQEYKDFITFFPFLDEAAYAQMQVAMAHYKMMEKPDRDKSEAEAAEDEFQTFLLKYPQSPLVPQATQKLREVQEILADGQFRVGRFYYMKQDYPASAARFMELTERYPLYSQSDEALWMLADVYSRAKRLSKNEDDKNHWADLAAECYDRIVKDYPLSSLDGDAKSQLKAMGMPVPAPDPNAVARMQKEQMYEKKHHERAMLRLPMALLKSEPNVAEAAHEGQPNLNPPDDAISATDILKPGAAGPSFDIAMRPASTSDSNADSGAGDPATMESEPTESSSAPGMSAGAEIIAAPTSVGDSPSPAPAEAPPADPPPTAGNTAAPAASTNSDPSIPTITLTPEPVTGTSTSAAPQATDPPPGTTQATTGSSTASTDQQAAKPTPAPQADKKTESTSKKKKGLHKLVPF
ncbi:MAG TPA: outer membrane protein assembly factor BamD [Candidatus Acidoferrales bacterium]|nr:outer membrane protein assembly factor BamD [Candidatus Acidoferrales bacterium]